MLRHEVLFFQSFYDRKSNNSIFVNGITLVYVINDVPTVLLYIKVIMELHNYFGFCNSIMFCCV